MIIHLPIDLESSIQAAIGDGRYASIDAAMTNAARLLVHELKRDPDLSPGSTHADPDPVVDESPTDPHASAGAESSNEPTPASAHKMYKNPSVSTARSRGGVQAGTEGASAGLPQETRYTPGYAMYKVASLFSGVFILVAQISLSGCGDAHNKRIEKTDTKRIVLSSNKEDMKANLHDLLANYSYSDTVKLMESNGFRCGLTTVDEKPCLHCVLDRSNGRLVTERFIVIIDFKNNIFNSLKIIHGYIGF